MKFFTFLCFIFLLPTHAFATDTSTLSLGISKGNTSYSSGLQPGVDDTDSTVSLIGLYNLTERLDIEGTISNFGVYEGSGLTTKLSGITVSLIAKTNSYNGFNAFAKAGYGTLILSQTAPFLGSSLQHKSVGDGLLASVGMGYTPDQLNSLTFRVSYDYLYFKTQASSTGEVESNAISALSVALIYKL